MHFCPFLYMHAFCILEIIVTFNFVYHFLNTEILVHMAIILKLTDIPLNAPLIDVGLF